ncbi:MAG: TRZ/ATZ family hydrolase [Gammaproteobacteria bacterium]|nr:TRZ/ATZ family hydrolase [Gammaproteobacteria bacterium]
MDKQLSLILPRWVIPVDGRSSTLEGHAVVIENQRIKSIMPSTDALQQFPSAEQVELPDHALIPGLINAHTHAAMSLFRGLADDISLMEWLNEHIWPAEARWVDPAFMRDGTELAIAEMLLSGTTCFNDMYFYPDVVAAVAQEAGIRATVGLIVLDFPSIWAADTDEYFSKGIAVHDDTRALSSIQTAMAPHAPYTVSDEPLRQAMTYADELQIHVHMHLHETADEIAGSMQQYGQRPLGRLQELGLLNPRLMAVHMVHLTDQEIELTAQQGVHVIHCPGSNLKLASGSCRVADLIAAGANVCLGTDSAASNNDLNMLGEMRTAALLAKNTGHDAAALPAAEILKMATINAATALNMQDEIGSIEVGKSADLTAINLNHVATQPVYDPVAQIVYSASREQVSDVWVQGKRLVKNHQLTRLDLGHVLSKAEDWGQKIQQHANNAGVQT